MNRGYLIVLTGIDGSGKTTQARLLVEKLKQDGLEVSYVWSRWEPFFLQPIIKIWKSSLAKKTPRAEASFRTIKDEKQKLLNNASFRWLWLGAFFVDYGLQVFIKITIGLLRRRLIISDRIFYDSIIDQAINLGNRKDRLLDSLDSFWMKFFFPEPDMVIYIDCPENIAFSRKDDAPNIDYLMERRELYLKLADRYDWLKIDGTLPVKEIAILIKDNVYKRLSAFREYVP